MDVRDVDLNLLVSLEALLAERHVTRAAERIGVSQPAMSAALARLRAIFHDPLLVRGPRGLTLTPRAEEIQGELAGVLGTVRRLVASPRGFDPATSERAFTLLGSDLIELELLPALVAALAAEAPGVQVIYRPSNPRNLDRLLAEGEVDLAVGFVPDASAQLIRTVVTRDSFVCIARRDHPALSGGLSLDLFVQLPHVQGLPRDATMYAAPIDAALAERGLVRRVVLWQPSFLPLAHVVAESDLLSTVPGRFARAMARHLPLRLDPPPMPLPPLEFALFWHARSQEDAGHRWLRERIAALLRGRAAGANAAN